MPENFEETLQVRFSNPEYTLAELKTIFSDLDWLGKYATDVVLNDYLDYEPPETRGRPRLPSLTVRGIHSGSLIMEILANAAFPAGSGAAILGALNAILKRGPEFVALPHRMRESWFAAAHDAELAKQKLRRLQKYAGAIETVGPDQDEFSGYGLPEITIPSPPEVEGDDAAV